MAIRPDRRGDPTGHPSPFPVDREIAEGIAGHLGARVELFVEEEEARRLGHLLSGEVDLCVAYPVASPEQEEGIAFSLAYGAVQDLLLERTEGSPGDSTRIGGGGTIGIEEGRTAAATVERIRARWPGVAIRRLPAGCPEHALDRVVSGELDAAVLDSRTWGALSQAYESLAATVMLTERALALAVRPDDPELLRRANEFLTSYALLGPSTDVHTDDLGGLVQRGRLRLLTRSGPASYFVQGGEQRGFEFELVKRFADHHGLRLEVIVPPTRADLVPWLLEGKGDVVAAGFTVTSERAEDVAFTRPYQNAHEVLTVREGSAVRDLDDLRGRHVYVHAGSPHHATLHELQQCEDDFEISLVPDSCDFATILDRVEDGTWDATVCDSNILEMERAAGRRLESAFPLKAVRHAWAVRPSNPELREALDAFVRSEYRGLHFNVIRRRYFQSSQAIARADESRSDVTGRISPYDEIIRECAERYGLDWRLVAAQMYQESRFDGEQVSPAGAAGLMQLMPLTAAELGFDDLHDAESSIRAGTMYLRDLIDRFDAQLPLATRIRFALASYNAGKGHVEDARRLAARLGWSPDRWYGNVEEAMLLLQLPEYYRDARYGYCRGGETVHYVREIDRNYRTYVEHVPVQVVSADTPLRPGAH